MIESTYDFEPSRPCSSPHHKMKRMVRSGRAGRGENAGGFDGHGRASAIIGGAKGTRTIPTIEVAGHDDNFIGASGAGS